MKLIKTLAITVALLVPAAAIAVPSIATASSSCCPCCPPGNGG
jgi:hypothetical protein